MFCGNDDIAIGVISALLDCGKRVPEDVSVVGFDDQPYVAMWRPAATTLRQDFRDLRVRAFTILSSIIDTGDVPVSSAVRPELIVRESTAALD